MELIGTIQFETGEHCGGLRFHWKDFQEEFCCLPQIGHRLVKRLALGGGPRFQIEGQVATFFGFGDNGAEDHDYYLSQSGELVEGRFIFEEGGFLAGHMECDSNYAAI